jgi:FAD/FMN-containing dehydrogenase/Fe-S oxidoreductase
MNSAVHAVPVNAAPLARSRLAARLRTVLKGQVLFDAFSRGRYSTDASIYQIEPLGVVVPADELDLQATIEIASEMGVPMLPRGAGTSQCGQTVGEALVIDCSRLNAVTALDVDAAQVEVQPGVVLDRLNAQLRAHGLWFPVDVSTSAQATVGGMAGNNSCGSRSLAYGTMVHNVTAIDAILADGVQERFGPFGMNSGRALGSGRSGELVSQLFSIGARERAEIERVWPTVLRRVGGYNLDVFHPRSERPYTADGSVNLAHLLVGSEGTLAHFRRLHLKLSPLPKARVLGVVNFPDFGQAMSCTQSIVALGPSAVELVDRTMIDLARANPAFRPVIESVLVASGGRSAQALLLVEFAGESLEPQRQALARLEELMGDHGLPGAVVALTGDREQKALWEVRKAGLNIMMSLKGDGKPVSFIEDCAVPLEHLAEYTARLTEVFQRHGTRGTWYAHASVGTLHVRPILDMRTDGARKMRSIAEEAAELVRRFKGAFSGEHGDGLVRSEWVGWQYGARLTRAFEEVKDLFDPRGLMNPGKIVRSTRMDQRELFRYRPGYAAEPLQTALDWSAWNVRNDPATETLSAPGTGGDPAGGFAKAVEMCNNNGHCRKLDPGAMCPSFRATRDEQHLTRGRANTLRLALSGQLGPDALVSEPMRETMSLCVSCKGCRRECPTGVDMARMKIEFLHHYRKRHGLSLRDRLIGALPRYAAWASRAAPVVNRLARLPGSGWLRERVLGLASARTLPRWHRTPFTGHGASGGAPADASASAPAVLLWADTFNNHFEPEILKAGRRVLEAAGRRVLVARPSPDDPEPDRPLCCGRTWLATGQVERAREEIARTLKAVNAPEVAHLPLIGLEPSCLLTFRDEALALGFAGEAERLAARSLLFEEYLAAERSADRLPELRFADQGGVRIHLHGHCHQKSFGLMGSVGEVLGWLPGASVTPIESGCCGMAGAFGYQAETFPVSQAIARLDLLPALAAVPEDALVVADGTSCRHQILDGAQRSALHVAQVLERALAAPAGS